MHEAMRRYGERLRSEKGLNLQLRIGINIGEMVVRTIQTSNARFRGLACIKRSLARRDDLEDQFARASV
jgi:hypothetical protein